MIYSGYRILLPFLVFNILREMVRSAHTSVPPAQTSSTTSRGLSKHSSRLPLVLWLLHADYIPTSWERVCRWGSGLPWVWSKRRANADEPIFSWPTSSLRKDIWSTTVRMALIHTSIDSSHWLKYQFNFATFIPFLPQVRRLWANNGRPTEWYDGLFYLILQLLIVFDIFREMFVASCERINAACASTYMTILMPRQLMLYSVLRLLFLAGNIDRTCRYLNQGSLVWNFALRYRFSERWWQMFEIKMCECSSCRMTVFMFCGSTWLIYLFILSLIPSSDDMATIKSLDRNAISVFVCDMNVYHEASLGSALTSLPKIR